MREAIDSNTRTYLHQFRLVTLTTTLLGILNSALLLVTGALCLALWQRGGMTTGEAAAGLALVLRLLAMSGWVMQTVRGVFENVGVIQESMQTISRPHGLVDASDAATLKVAGGDIRFENVGFHYGRGDANVIENLSLHIRAGEKVGLVGVSGAGRKELTAELIWEGEVRKLRAEGTGVLSGALAALNSQIEGTLAVREYAEHAIGEGTDVQAVSYVELGYEVPGQTKRETAWGVASDSDIAASGLKAVMRAASALNLVPRNLANGH